MKEDLNLCMVAFLFDSGKIESSFYGEVIFEHLIKGNELSNNMSKVVVSEGDVFHREAYDDITPYTIKNELCTIKKVDDKCRDYIFAVLIEDISVNNAIKLDKRIKEECIAYLGMTSIDIDSTDVRKQFWKMLRRDYSIEGETLTCFGNEEAGFAYSKKAKEYGFRVNYDGFPDEQECDNQIRLFSTRQSSFITKVEQLEVKKGKNDSDRGISEMNYSLVKEVEIAGVQIWKAIEDINRVYIPKNDNWVIVDYLFISLYEVAQGIERLFKILIELMFYAHRSIYNRKKVDELLLSHNHVAMYEFVNQKEKLSFGKNERKLLECISKFYNEGRYNRFVYSEHTLMELKLLQKFGSDIKEEEFDDKIKHRYGKTIGHISHTLYDVIRKLSYELNIYVYELNNQSVANFVLSNYYKDDLYGILKEIENSKKELLWYILKKGKDLTITQVGENIEALPFDYMNLQMVLEELICNKNSGEIIYNFVSNEYDEQVAEDKDKWKERLEFIEIIGNTNVCFEEDDWGDEEEN
ncbi:hypothetical protein [Holdemania filiformis]|uniref:hypothetical protein n=3 Tax=Holdemania filiformis TaxID=61171 RepID=UPI0026755227|nr:hypothetical protein [Holdemania filiformis]